MPECLNIMCVPILEVIMRVVIVYFLGVFLVRLGKRRFLGAPTPLDIVLLLIFGSVMGKAITGDVPFIPTLVAGTMIILLHSFFSYITFYSSFMGRIFKGEPILIIKDGKIIWSQLRRNHISEKDLLGALRLNGRVRDPQDVELAYLERNGDISVIPFSCDVKTTKTDDGHGMQKICIELERKK